LRVARRPDLSVRNPRDPGAPLEYEIEVLKARLDGYVALVGPTLHEIEEDCQADELGG
jgi:hypothetical protein